MGNQRLDRRALFAAAGGLGTALLAGGGSALAGPAIGTVFGGTLRLRSGPGTGYSIVTNMPNGTKVTIYAGPYSGWYKVTYGSTIGWCSSSYLNVGSHSTTGSATVFDGTLRLRSGPSSSYMTLLTLPDGAKVGVLGGPSNGYYQVLYNGVVGWSSGTWLSFGGSSTSDTAYVDTDILNLRSGPSTSNGILAKMINGETVKIVSSSGSWYKVNYYGTVGWAHGDYLNFDGDSWSFWVPTHQQEHTLSCEYASLQIATEALGDKVPEDDFIDVVGFDPNPHVGFRGDIDGAYFSLDDYGVYPEPLVVALPEFGFKGTAFYGGRQTLIDHLAAGHPTLVFVDMKPDSTVQLNIGGDMVTMSIYSHVIVAYGYSPDGVLISDPDSSVRKKLYSWSKFHSMWDPMDQMALAVSWP